VKQHNWIVKKERSSCKSCAFPNRKAILQDGTEKRLNICSAAFFVVNKMGNVNLYISTRKIPFDIYMNKLYFCIKSIVLIFY
jgi:hypothetical protein